MPDLFAGVVNYGVSFYLDRLQIGPQALQNIRRQTIEQLVTGRGGPVRQLAALHVVSSLLAGIHDPPYIRVVAFTSAAAGQCIIADHFLEPDNYRVVVWVS